MVLTDAGALPQAQGSSRNRRKLLHLVMEPSDSLLGSFSHVCKSFCLYTNTGARDSWQSVPCKETSALSAKRWFKARNWQRRANLKDLRVVSGQTMVQKWPNDGSSHRPYHNLASFVRQIGERKAQACAYPPSRELRWTKCGVRAAECRCGGARPGKNRLQRHAQPANCKAPYSTSLKNGNEKSTV